MSVSNTEKTVKDIRRNTRRKFSTLGQAEHSRLLRNRAFAAWESVKAK